MEAHRAVGRALRLLREQEGWSQAELASRVEPEGLRLDPSAVARIERGERDVRVGELLALAAGLGVAPPLLLAPPNGQSVEVGSRSLTAAQVLDWLGGDPAALTATSRRTVEELRRDAAESEAMRHLVEQVAVLVQAVKRRDRAAVIFGATHIHATLGALTQWMLSDDDIGRIAAEYDIPGDE